jgi:hypothetical protein
MKFCSEHSRTLGEPLPGLGYVPSRIALLAWPKTHWGESAAEARGLTADLRRALELADESDTVRVQLVRGSKRDSSRGRVDLYLFPERRAWRSLDQEAAAKVISEVAAGRSPVADGSEPFADTLVLCCTDGKVDACCAKFGKATERALAAAAADYPGIRVWETAHVGGCRLAASCLVLPQRSLYSRVEPSHASAFVQAIASDRIYLPCYRGDPDLDEPDQVAHAAALGWAQRHGLPERVRIERRDQPDADRLDVQVHVGDPVDSRSGRRLRISCRRQDFSIYSNCSKRRAGETYPFPRWFAVALEPVER